MSNRVEVKISSSNETGVNVWTVDTLEIHGGEKVVWESSGKRMVLFFPDKNLFEGRAEQRVFEIEAKSGARLELTPARLKPGETRAVPYAVFHAVSENKEDVTARAKMIIRRTIA